jgi:hypothetical protein
MNTTEKKHRTTETASRTTIRESPQTCFKSTGTFICDDDLFMLCDNPNWYSKLQKNGERQELRSSNPVRRVLVRGHPNFTTSWSFCLDVRYTHSTLVGSCTAAALAHTHERMNDVFFVA